MVLRPHFRRTRGGLSLLEMTIATATMATLMASVVVLVRTGYQAWDSYENDLEITDNGYATLRHIVRNLRQAEAVTSISAATDTSGQLSVIMPDTSTYTWDHNNGNDYVYFDDGGGPLPLSWKIDELTFIGYEMDGVTTTTVVADVQMVESRIQITLPHGAGVPVTLSQRCWIRSW